MTAPGPVRSLCVGCAPTAYPTPGVLAALPLVSRSTRPSRPQTAGATGPRSAKRKRTLVGAATSGRVISSIEPGCGGTAPGSVAAPGGGRRG
jgi:hypothetical protein